MIFHFRAYTALTAAPCGSLPASLCPPVLLPICYFTLAFLYYLTYATSFPLAAPLLRASAPVLDFRKNAISTTKKDTAHAMSLKFYHFYLVI